MVIWGNHSATHYPDVYNAKINGQPVTEVITDSEWIQSTFISKVQKRGAEIIAARGASSAASAANGIVDSVRKLTTDTAAGDYFSMCICSEGQYETEDELITSLPCRVSSGQLKSSMDWNLPLAAKLNATIAELKSEREAVKICWHKSVSDRLQLERPTVPARVAVLLFCGLH